jgi:hypothetical protein
VWLLCCVYDVSVFNESTTICFNPLVAIVINCMQLGANIKKHIHKHAARAYHTHVYWSETILRLPVVNSSPSI